MFNNLIEKEYYDKLGTFHLNEVARYERELEVLNQQEGILKEKIAKYES